MAAPKYCKCQYLRLCVQAHTDCTSELNGSFFLVIPMSGCVSNLLAAAVMFLYPSAIGPLFLFLTVVSTLGVLSLCFLPRPDADSLLDVSCSCLKGEDDFFSEYNRKDVPGPLGGLDQLSAEIKEGERFASLLTHRGCIAFFPTAEDECKSAVRRTSHTSQLFALFPEGRMKSLLSESFERTCLYSWVV